MCVNRTRNEVVLVAVVGMSPAVLTETIWALAHEDPPCIPDRIITLCTTRAREHLVKVFFGDKNWAGFIKELMQRGINCDNRLKFGPADDHMRLFPRPDGQGNLDDITISSDSEAAADFIMRTLREFTENPATQVIASIAGGRKTMSALMTSCMSLLGRKQDRLCHVLVSPPFDNPILKPVFYYPQKGGVHLLSDEDAHNAESAVIELTDIPFVRVRGWYEQLHNQAPPDYMSLINSVQECIPDPMDLPDIMIDLHQGTFNIAASPVELSAFESAIFFILLKKLKQNGSSPLAWMDILDDLDALKKQTNIPDAAIWLHDFQANTAEPDKDTLRKTAHTLKSKLNKSPLGPQLTKRILPNMRKRDEFTPYPAEKIEIIGTADAI